MRERHSFGTSCSTRGMEDQGDIIWLSSLERRAFASQLSCLFHIEYDLLAIVVALGNGCIVFLRSSYSCCILRKSTFGNQSDGGAQVIDVELKFGLLVCWVQGCGNRPLP